MLEHALEFRGMFLDVEVLERDLPPLVVVTGGLRVGSGVLAEDVDHAHLDGLRSYIGRSGPQIIYLSNVLDSIVKHFT